MRRRRSQQGSAWRLYHVSLVLELLVAVDLRWAVRVKLLQQLLLEKGLGHRVQWGLLGMADELLG